LLVCLSIYIKLSVYFSLSVPVKCTCFGLVAMSTIRGTSAAASQLPIISLYWMFLLWLVQTDHECTMAALLVVFISSSLIFFLMLL